MRFTLGGLSVHLAGYQVCIAVFLWNFVPNTKGSTTSHHENHSQPQHEATTSREHGSHESHTPTISPHATTPNNTRIELTLPPPISPLEIKQKLEDMLIVPDVVHTAPEQKIDVWFGTYFAEMGNVVHEDVVSKQPVLLLWKWNPGDFFTLIVTGPDVPNSELPTDAEWRHWIVMNIPGNDVLKGYTLRDYVGFGNETELGIHRMVFLVFKQPRPYMRSPEAILRTSDSAYRGFFSTRNFVRMHNLGIPVAANFILVNCTNIIHDPVAWAGMTSHPTTHPTTSESTKLKTEGVTT
nr:PREDICTED: OV-16 antigen-like [Bemisia tabaci]